MVLAQKCLQPCVNGVLKFQFFFLNLSSKVLAGVIVRTSKYPYMDICVQNALGGVYVKIMPKQVTLYYIYIFSAR